MVVQSPKFFLALCVASIFETLMDTIKASSPNLNMLIFITPLIYSNMIDCLVEDFAVILTVCHGKLKKIVH